MGKYMRTGKRGGEVGVEETHASMGVRTRARTLAMEKAMLSSSTKADASPLLDPAAAPSLEGHDCYLELRSRRLEKVMRFDTRQGSCGNALASERHSVGKSDGHSRSASVEGYPPNVCNKAASNHSFCRSSFQAPHCSGSLSGRGSFNAAVLRADAPLGVDMGVVSVGKMRLRSSSLSSHGLKIRKNLDSNGSKMVTLPLQMRSEEHSGAGDAAIELSFEMEASYGDSLMDYECLSNHENQSVLFRDLREGTPISDVSRLEVAMEAPGSTSRVRVGQSFSVVALRSPIEALVVPTCHEIEEFFSQMDEQKVQQLSERYNFDFDDDVPLQGRFEWCNLQH